MEVVILAAGMGSRLGGALPKPMVGLASGRTILETQLDALDGLGLRRPPIVVVGFKKDLVMEAHPDLVFVYNAEFDRTNTARSLAWGLRACGDGPVVWLNGDVVFDPDLLRLVRDRALAGRSVVVVRRGEVGDEEVGYQTDDAANVTSISKALDWSEGEAIGVNVIAAEHRTRLIAALDACGDDDYFERALQSLIEDGLQMEALDVGDLRCIEIDFVADLDEANRMFDQS